MAVYLGERQENTLDNMPVKRAKHTPSHLPMGSWDSSVSDLVCRRKVKDLEGTHENKEKLF